MSLISLHRKYNFTDFQNRVCSIAFLVTLSLVLVSIILPFVWILKINDGISTDTIAFEQPRIKQKFKYMFLAENSMDGKVVLCSSFGFLNQREDTDDCAKVSIIEKDQNFDGLIDEIDFTFDFHTMFHYGIKSTSIVIFLDARLDQKCKFHIPSAIVIKKRETSIISNMNDRKITIRGSLQPSQDSALQCPFSMRHVQSHFFHETLNENQTDIRQFNIGTIMERLERNSIHFRFQEESNEIDIEPEKTSINIKLKISEMSIRYKKSWIQIINEVW